VEGHRTVPGAGDELLDELDARAAYVRRRALRDHAAYRLDPSAALVRGNGTIAVPLVPNPDFGRPLVQLAPGRTLRFGLQMRY